MDEQISNIQNEDKVEIVEDPYEGQAVASLNDIQQMFLQSNYSNGLSIFSDFAIPKDYKSKIKKAKEIRNYSIAKRAIKIRMDYTLPIKEFNCKSTRQQKFYNEYVLPLVKRISRQFIQERWSIGEVYCHYGFKKDKKTPMYLLIEDAEDITPVSALGYEIYKIRVSQDLKKQIQKLKDEKQIDKLPSYLQKAISNNGNISNEITLTNENMNRLAVDKLDYDKHITPPILDILKQLSLREFLLDLDRMNVFGSEKNSFVHTRVGTDKEPEKNGTLVTKVHNLVANDRGFGQKFVTTRGDVKIEIIHDVLAEILKPERYDQSNIDIMDYFGIPIVFTPYATDSNNNGDSVKINLKPFEQSLYSDRNMFEGFILPFINQINKANGFKEIPKLEYDEINLKDITDKIKELQFQREQGILYFKKLCEIFGLDYDEVKNEKIQDWKDRDWQAETVELSQGTSPMLNLKFKQMMDLKNKQNSESEKES